MKLTNKGRYAVMAMADLALNSKDGPISLTEISLRQNISLAYLEQIFLKLKNNNIIVTGATGGIGNSIIKKLYDAGANILATGTKNEKLEELTQKFQNIKVLKFDISQTDNLENFIEDATKQLGGRLDCIVNNAGITQDNLAIRMSTEEWKRVIDINLTSTFLISKFAIKKMLKNKKGKIIKFSWKKIIK